MCFFCSIKKINGKKTLLKSSWSLPFGAHGLEGLCVGFGIIILVSQRSLHLLVVVALVVHCANFIERWVIGSGHLHIAIGRGKSRLLHVMFRHLGQSP